jgi:hypothetical protein
MRKRVSSFMIAALLPIFVPSPRGSTCRCSPKLEIAGHKVLSFSGLDDWGIPGGFRATSIFQDRSGDYWLSANNHHLLRFRPEVGEVRSARDGSWGVRRMCESGDGVLWFSSGFLLDVGCHVERFDGLNWSVLWGYEMLNLARAGDHPRRTEIHTMFQGMHGRVWFPMDDALVWYDGKVWSAYQAVSEPLGTRSHSPIHFTTGLEDSDGYVWLSLRAGPIVGFDPSTSTLREWYPGGEDDLASHKTSRRGTVPGETVLDIYRGRDGRIWFAGSLGHLYVYDKRTSLWTTLGLPTLLGEAAANDAANQDPGLTLAAHLYQDRNGMVMVGTNRGLVIFRETDGKMELLTTSNSALPGDFINCLVEDRAGRIWIGTDKGLVVLEQ